VLFANLVEFLLRIFLCCDEIDHDLMWFFCGLKTVMMMNVNFDGEFLRINVDLLNL